MVNNNKFIKLHLTSVFSHKFAVSNEMPKLQIILFRNYNYYNSTGVYLIKLHTTIPGEVGAFHILLVDDSDTGWMVVQVS